MARLVALAAKAGIDIHGPLPEEPEDFYRPGFKTEVRSRVSLVVGQEAVVNLRLEVGELTQEVTVVEETPIVNLTTSSVAGIVGEREVKDLP
jgi:hypothetical protein